MRNQIICITIADDDPPPERLVRRGPCSNVANHTPEPAGYLDWHAWAARMSKTHRQERCPKCELFCIWVQKKKRVAIPAVGRG